MTKKKKNIIGFTFLGLLIILYAIFITIRMNKWQNHLNSSDRILTSVLVYDFHKVKGTRYYEYVYKA